MKDLPATEGTEKGTAVKIRPPQDLANRVSEVHAMIARRAYELFANRGCEHGRICKIGLRPSRILCMSAVMT
jgi:hypothetical protein